MLMTLLSHLRRFWWVFHKAWRLAEKHMMLCDAVNGEREGLAGSWVPEVLFSGQWLGIVGAS